MNALTHDVGQLDFDDDELSVGATTTRPKAQPPPQCCGLSLSAYARVVIAASLAAPLHRAATTDTDDYCTRERNFGPDGHGHGPTSLVPAPTDAD